MDNTLSHTAWLRHANTNVVLLAPELLTARPDQAALLATLHQPCARIRLLLRLAVPGDLDLAEALARAGVAVQVLAPAGMALPPNTLPMACMPPESTEMETNKLALALSDYLLVSEAPPDLPLMQLARKLDKSLVTPGTLLPKLSDTQRSIAHRLDPEQRGWHRWLSWLWGRPEQLLLELFAFNWRGRRDDGIARSFGRLRACLSGRNWQPGPYFAPEAPKHWNELVPDRAALDANCPIVERFDRLDRSAVHGAYIHRDLAWVAHLAAASAVFLAVAGEIGTGAAFPPEWFWPTCELFALIIILLTTFSSRLFRLQDRWTACRFGAEQLRIARMCLPLLVVPDALHSVSRGTNEEAERALSEVKRAVRDQGLPDVSPTLTATQAAGWLGFMVDDQRAYHSNNRQKLHCAENRLNFVTVLLFFLAFVAVCAHLFLHVHSKCLLLATAAMPAFAAAIHGVSTRLGLIHRVDLSKDVEDELAIIGKELRRLISGSTAPGWAAVREVALRAADAMARESTSWHSQVRRQKDDLA